jgi:mRNA-degrading endonuclease RelE of RelBE toxin-antitoxin system
VSFSISITPTGQRSVDALRGKARKSFDAAVRRLAAEGCKAGDYRLTGEGADHICAMHLYGRYRLLIGFPDDRQVVVLLVGEHKTDDPDLDVYRSLYRLLDLPEPTTKRTKPPCCDEAGQGPVDSEVFDRFSAGAKALVRRRRRAK